MILQHISVMLVMQFVTSYTTSSIFSVSEHPQAGNWTRVARG